MEVLYTVQYCIHKIKKAKSHKKHFIPPYSAKGTKNCWIVWSAYGQLPATRQAWAQLRWCGATAAVVGWSDIGTFCDFR